MKVKMFRGEVFEAEKALVRFSTREVGLELSLAIAKNKRLITRQAHDLREAMQPKFSDEEQPRQDAFGKELFLLERQYRNDPKKWQEEKDALDIEYADELFRRDEQHEERNKFLGVETDVEVYAIRRSLLPEMLKAEELGPMVAAVIEDEKTEQTEA